MKLNKQVLFAVLMLLLPFVAYASEAQHILDGFQDLVIAGLLAVFIIALNIRAFSSGDVLPIALAMNGLLLLIFLFRTNEDNMVFNLSIAASLLILGIAQLVVAKRRG